MNRELQLLAEGEAQHAAWRTPSSRRRARSVSPPVAVQRRRLDFDDNGQLRDLDPEDEAMLDDLYADDQLWQSDSDTEEMPQEEEASSSARLVPFFGENQSDPNDTEDPAPLVMGFFRGYIPYYDLGHLENLINTHNPEDQYF